jgi:hypothetical protein
MKKITLTTIILFFTFLFSYSQKEDTYKKLKDSVLSKNTYLLRSKSSYTFFFYNQECVLVFDRNAFYFKANKNGASDSLVNNKIVDDFMKVRLRNNIDLAKLLRDSDITKLKYNGLGNVYYFDKRNNKIVFNFYKPLSLFWGNPKYDKFIQRLYGLYGYFYSKNL